MAISALTHSSLYHLTQFPDSIGRLQCMEPFRLRNNIYGHKMYMSTPMSWMSHTASTKLINRRKALKDPLREWVSHPQDRCDITDRLE